MRALVTPRSFAKTDRTPLAMLEEAGFEVLRNPKDRPLTEAELIELLPGVDGIIVGVDRLSRRVIEAADALKVVSKYGVGIDNVDVEAATARGIPVTITPGANTTAVAELTIGLMFALARQIPFADRLVREGSWSSVMGRELSGKRLGLVGLGRIGREVAKKASAFDMKIVAFDRDRNLVARYGVEYADLADLVATCDFVSIHLPLDDSTRNLIGEKELRKMKRDAYLINTSRGGIVDERALVRALREGWIAGAALDVYEEEPPANEELKRLPNVVLTPHMGAHTVEALASMGRQAASNLISALCGTLDPAVVVNPEVLNKRR